MGRAVPRTSGRGAATLAGMATKKTGSREGMLMFRASDEERDAMFAAAESLGMAFSVWARMVLLKEARKLKRRDGD
jgi:hypothetical protein